MFHHNPKNDEAKELDPAKGFGGIGEPYTGGSFGISPGPLSVVSTPGATSDGPATHLGASNLASAALLGLGVSAGSLASTPLPGAPSPTSTAANPGHSFKEDGTANSPGVAKAWEAGRDRPAMENGERKHSDTHPKTPPKPKSPSAQPPDCTGLDSKSVGASRLGESPPGTAKPNLATTPRDEKTKPTPSTEQAYIDPQIAAIKELKDAIVTELHSIESKTGESSWDFFYKNIGTVAALGASITFALIVTDIKDPRSISRHGWIDLPTVRILLATSWILFMAVLSLSFSFAQKLKGESCGLTLSHLIYLLELAAVMCLAFVVAAYVEVVGYVGIALVLCAVTAVLVQAVTQRP